MDTNREEFGRLIEAIDAASRRVSDAVVAVQRVEEELHAARVALLVLTEQAKIFVDHQPSFVAPEWRLPSGTVS